MTDSSTLTFDELVDLYRQDQAQRRYDEVVTQLEHGLQCATLAEAAGADDATIAAALLHDVGHLILKDGKPLSEELTEDFLHEQAGADAVEPILGAHVADQIRLHVAAKRYLCAVDPTYHDLLSPASVRSLVVQGGPMSPEEAAQFEAQDGFAGAVQIRRWDDAGKVEDLDVKPLTHWIPLLERLAA
jgi:phosphonate degradation associated HDIG domain protein